MRLSFLALALTGAFALAFAAAPAGAALQYYPLIPAEMLTTVTPAVDVPYTLEGRAQAIACPTLLTMAERDPLGASAPKLYDALTCPKRLVRFSAAEGAGMHCEHMNRSPLNRIVFDWLDETLPEPCPSLGKHP
jgi:hypothetical protein